MARGIRKAASDSLAAQRAKAQAPDLSNVEAPRDVPVLQHLGAVGLDAYDRLFRSRAEWTEADLILIAQAARSIELIDKAERELKGQPMIVSAERTAPKSNPLLLFIRSEQETVQRCLRDAHLRSRDGASPSNTAAVPASPSPSSGTKGGKNVTDFDSWLK